jgi:hypothetical protein
MVAPARSSDFIRIVVSSVWIEVPGRQPPDVQALDRLIAARQEERRSPRRVGTFIPSRCGSRQWLRNRTSM